MLSRLSAATALRASRGALISLALVLPLTLTSPASAETQVVKDDQKDGGLRVMTVKRGAALVVVTRFSRASDLHKFRILEPGRSKPTFVISWRTDRPGNDIKYIKVRQTRKTRDSGPRGTCRVARVKFAGLDSGPASHKMEFSLQQSCLWVGEENLPRYRVDQRSFDVTDGVRTRTDRLGYTRPLSLR